MSTLHWQRDGTGKCQLVLLHGWGLNAQVWRYISLELRSHFTVHSVDLPGFGQSLGFGAMRLAEMTDCLLQDAPDRAVWLGWSLGGLLASDIALRAPQRVQALITVASSPCFVARAGWPGVSEPVLQQFQQQLHDDYQQTVERFLVLQTLGSPTAREDLRALKAAIFAQPVPEIGVLNGGLEMLRQTDLRPQLSQLAVPLLSIYGGLDGLVPRKIAGLLDQFLPATVLCLPRLSQVMPKAAHAPFISHPAEFCQAVCEFCALWR